MRRAAVVVLAALVIAVAGLSAIPGASVEAATAPPDFTDSLVGAVSQPTALAFTPDGRMLVTTQTGRVFVGRNGTIGSSPVLDISARVCTTSERGLLGIAVDPQFTTNHFVYVYYTQKTPTGTCPTGATRTIPAPANHVARFVLADNDTMSGEFTVIEQIPSYNGNHNGGDLVFGPDGKLYVAVGDGGCDIIAGGGCQGANDVSRDTNTALGKILRINRDGTAPSDNPFFGQSTNRCVDDGFTEAGKHCPETWAWGFRNPFRMAFGPAGQLLVNDVGQGAWEEIDNIQPGADYGWNVREGPCVNGSTSDCGPPPGGLTNPMHAYSHAATGCRSITGAAFVPSASWPAEYQGDYLFADYICGKIFRLQPGGSGFEQLEFVTNLGASSAVHLEFGPDNALYYTSYAGGGEVRRIAYGATPPSSTTTSTSTSTTLPPAGTTYLSSLNPTQAVNGLGPFERDRHNGGAAAGDGGELRLNGAFHARGLGVSPFSELTYALGGQYTSFQTQFGIDDSCGASGSARIEVHVNGAAVYASPFVGASSPGIPININVTGKTSLRLVVVGAAGHSCNRADLGSARLIGPGTPPSSTTTTTTAPPSSTTPTTTSVPTTTTSPSSTTTTTRPPGTTYLSSLTPTFAKNGLGPFERNRHNGGAAAGDGGPLVLNGTPYAFGLGVHAYSEMSFALNGQYRRFLVDLGIDDSCGAAGSVRAEVHVNGSAVFATDVLRGSSSTVPVSVTVTGKNSLRLVLTNAGDGNTCDRFDWANARLLS